MKIVNMKNRKKQKGSFAVEAALVSLVLICAGFGFFVAGKHIIGTPGSCTVSNFGGGSSLSPPPALNMEISLNGAAYGLNGLLGGIICKMNAISGFSSTSTNSNFTWTLGVSDIAYTSSP